MHFQLGPPPHTPQGSHAPWGGICLRLGFSSTHACMTAQGAAQGYKNKGLKSSPPSFRRNLQPARATLFFLSASTCFVSCSVYERADEQITAGRTDTVTSNAHVEDFRSRCRRVEFQYLVAADMF